MTLDDFKTKVEARDQRQINRNTDACNWYFEDVELFHERTRWGGFDNRPTKTRTIAQLAALAFGHTTTSYWSYTTYADLDLANLDASKYGAVVEKEFYCDDNNPYWFLIFHALDKAIEHAFDQLEKLRITQAENAKKLAAKEQKAWRVSKFFITYLSDLFWP